MSSANWRPFCLGLKQNKSMDVISFATSFIDISCLSIYITRFRAKPLAHAFVTLGPISQRADKFIIKILLKILATLGCQVMNISNHNFVHATKVQLSWHMQNWDLIASSNYNLQQIEFSQDHKVLAHKDIDLLETLDVVITTSSSMSDGKFSILMGKLATVLVLLSIFEKMDCFIRVQHCISLLCQKVSLNIQY